MAITTISRRQTPAFRAKIATESGTLFDASTDLATTADLTAEGITAAPISASFFKTESQLYYNATGQSTPVQGFQNVEIDDESFIAPATVAAQSLDYNFNWVPDSRTSFPFSESGMYFVDFTVYPKTGAAIVWRTWVLVQ